MEKDTYNVMVTSRTGVSEYPEDYQDYLAGENQIPLFPGTKRRCGQRPRGGR